MKKASFLLLSLILLTCFGNAQTNDKPLEKNRAFTGAKATAKYYHAIYQMIIMIQRLSRKLFAISTMP